MMPPLLNKNPGKHMQTPQRISLKWYTGLQDKRQIYFTADPFKPWTTPGPALPEEPRDGDRADGNAASSFTKETDVTYQTNQRDR